MMDDDAEAGGGGRWVLVEQKKEIEKERKVKKGGLTFSRLNNFFYLFFIKIKGPSHVAQPNWFKGRCLSRHKGTEVQPQVSLTCIDVTCESTT